MDIHLCQLTQMYVDGFDDLIARKTNALPVIKIAVGDFQRM